MENLFHQKLILSSYENGVQIDLFLSFVIKSIKSLTNGLFLREPFSLLIFSVKFLVEKIKTIGTAACPPYHLALVVGGMSAEMNLKSVKLASTKYYDGLKTQDDFPDGVNPGVAFRDTEWEAKILKMCQDMGIGAQFGGKYFCHDVRVIRLPRHGASVPVGLGVSCSADRQALAKITPEGVFLEQVRCNVFKLRIYSLCHYTLCNCCAIVHYTTRSCNCRKNTFS